MRNPGYCKGSVSRAFSISSTRAVISVSWLNASAWYFFGDNKVNCTKDGAVTGYQYLTGACPNQPNLRAQNLLLFLQLADGVDDATWEHHRREGDYSHWLKDSIKDVDLAAAVARIEALAKIDPLEGRREIREAIERDYTLPAVGPLPVPEAND